MTNTRCDYSGNRDAVLVGYLYDDIDPVIRSAFDAHLTTCAACREELAELRAVRTGLSTWVLPDTAIEVDGSAIMPRPRRWWQELPAWAQAAAAVLVLGAAAGLANLDVRFNREGVSVRTGWTASRAALTADGAITEPAWRAELTALESRLRSELQPPTSTPVTAVDAAAARTQQALNTESLARVRTLIGESERRQQNELALRLAEIVREVNAQRQADLVRIDRTLGQFQNNTGVEVMRQRQLLDYVLQRASQRQ